MASSLTCTGESVAAGLVRGVFAVAEVMLPCRTQYGTPGAVAAADCNQSPGLKGAG